MADALRRANTPRIPELRLLLTLPLTIVASETPMTYAHNAREIAQVRKLLQQTPLIDGHNDLPWQCHKLNPDLNRINLNADTSGLKMVTDIPRLRAGGLGGQFWSVYVPVTLSGPEAVK